MNSFSFALIVLFGLFFGYAFPALLGEAGVSTKFARSWLVVFGLGLFSFAVYMVYPFFTFGILSFNNLESFYTAFDGIYLWMSIALMLGAAANVLSGSFSLPSFPKISIKSD